MDLLQKAGANDSVGKLAGSVGLGDSQAKDLIGALSPALLRSLQKQATSSGGLEALQSALAKGNHQQYIDQPELMQSEATREDGNKILGHLFGSKDVSRNIAAQAAQETGIDASMIKKALPLLAGLAMGALSKKTSGGADVSEAAGGGGLGGLLGGLLGGSSGKE
ncbi:MAG: DUF937 domain-containing protein, partial [Gammaproteobacteria bacterium]|nr:DUF937 domain-containing protein [Gammaproteobacteria bacterium]